MRRRDVVWGAVLGTLGGLWGVYFRDATGEAPFSSQQLMEQGAIGLVGGASAGLVLFITRPFSTRGKWHHYLSWVLAADFGALVIMLPEIIHDGILAVAFALFMGLCVGLPLGAVAKILNQEER